MRTDFTLVVGVDASHIPQLKIVWPTWMKHKPELRERRLVVFYDVGSVGTTEVLSLLRFLDHPHGEFFPWPNDERWMWRGHWGDASDKWNNPQRHKMLAGFVHVAASQVVTPYWMKLDVDTVATSSPYPVLEESWLADRPAIVSQPWSYTKPPDQMLKLDAWADKCSAFFPTGPLNLEPRIGSSVLRHKRIISWCAFFESEFTRKCSHLSWVTNESPMLPVPSQDGYMWYVAQRLERQVKLVNMKERGWQHWATMQNITKYAEESLR